MGTAQFKATRCFSKQTRPTETSVISINELCFRNIKTTQPLDLYSQKTVFEKLVYRHILKNIAGQLVTKKLLSIVRLLAILPTLIH